MKKLLSILLLLFLSFSINFTLAYDDDLLNIAASNDDLSTSKTELLKSFKGRKYIKIIDAFVEKNNSNKEALSKILDKTQPLITDGKITNQETLNIIKYMNAMISHSMMDIIGLEYFEKSLGIYDISSNTSTGFLDLKITIIEDARCNNCNVDLILDQLLELPSMQNAEIIRTDFSNSGVEAYLIKNNIKVLPLIVFSTDNFDVSVDPEQLSEFGESYPKIDGFLSSIENGGFYLEVGANFDPFEERSERGFKVLSEEDLAKLQENNYINGNSETTITWLEYSDLQCPYCAKLHNSGTEEELFKKYGDSLNKMYNHFPLSFHENAQTGAEILECVAEQKGSEAYFDLIKTSYAEENSTEYFLINEATKLGASEDLINTCLENGDYTQKVEEQMKNGADLYGITGTPGNVLINNKTGEYEIISGAYPTASFIEVIDNLLTK